MSDTNPRQTYSYFTGELNKIGLGYLHMVESVGGWMGAVPKEARMAHIIRSIFKGTLILNGGYDANSGNEAIEKGYSDLISFGVLFLANPDLPLSFRKNAPLNSPDVATYYLGEGKGYIDYPKLSD